MWPVKPNGWIRYALHPYECMSARRLAASIMNVHPVELTTSNRMGDGRCNRTRSAWKLSWIRCSDNPAAKAMISKLGIGGPAVGIVAGRHQLCALPPSLCTHGPSHRLLPIAMPISDELRRIALAG